MYVTIPTPDATYEATVVEIVHDCQDATVCIVDVEDAGRFAAIVYDSGDVITSSDWQGTCGHDDPETVRDEVGDPRWAHHWVRSRDGAPCVTVDGLPRVLE